MKAGFNLDVGKQNRTKQLLGLSYGLTIGLAFTITAWGIDAYQLGQSSVDFFWLKLVIGGLAALIIGGLVGWLGEKTDNGLVSFVLWLAAAYLFAQVASQLPFGITSKATAILDPNVKGLAIYPFPSNMDRRMIIVYMVTFLSGGLGGALQGFLVDSALGAASTFTRCLAICGCVPFFLLAGNAADNLNSPLRGSLVATHKAIEYTKANHGKPINLQVASDLGLYAVNPIQNLLNRPYHLILGTYDPEDMSSVSIYINFDGTWATCSALYDRPSNCEPSQVVYLDKLKDLLANGQDSSGTLLAAGSVSQWMAAWKDQGNQPAGLVIKEQRGTAVLVEVQDQKGRAYQCRLEVDSSDKIQLETCSASGQPGSISQVSGLSSPTTSPTQPVATPTYTSVFTYTLNMSGTVDQAAALLPSAVPDLKGLPDLTTYNLQAKVDFAQHTFVGHSRVETTNHTKASLDRLYFRLFPNGGRSYGNGSLRVSQVSQNGQSLKTSLSVQDSVLEVRLAAPLPSGARTSLEMDFNGATPLSFGGGYGIYNYSDDILTLANWYPILAVDDEKGWHLDPTTAIGDSVYSEMAYYTVALTAPSDLVVAATGVTVKRVDQAGASTYLMASGPARDFFMALSPDFLIDSQQVDGTQVNSFYLPQNTSGGQQALQVAGHALHDYNNLFGPYPYRELDVVETPIQDALGVEYPGIVLAASSVYASPSDNTFITVVAHEVGHQWWYNIVGNNVLQDPWLDEGLTTFTSMLYFEDEEGTFGYQGISDYYQNRYTTYLQNHPDDLVTASVAYYEEQPEGGSAYSTMIYTKAALFFKALRETIGDKAFFQALKDYYKTEKYKVAVPQDLLDEFEKASGQKLGDFYQKWLYSKSQP